MVGGPENDVNVIKLVVISPQFLLRWNVVGGPENDVNVIKLVVISPQFLLRWNVVGSPENDVNVIKLVVAVFSPSVLTAVECGWWP